MNNQAVPSKTPITLTIAGSDSGGGAGIQADIKAISATGGYACSVITALTAQNTQGVHGIYSIPANFVAEQLDAVFQDLDIKAVKIGMLSDSNIISIIAHKLRQYQPKYLVVDPVMVATSGDLLLEHNAISTLKEQLLPLADVITPNLPEAAALLDCAQPKTEEDMEAIIEQLRQLGAHSVLLKGGHLGNTTNSTDLLILPHDVLRFTTPRIDTQNTHGTGCTLSAAIASYLAQGYSLTGAVKAAKHYISNAIAHADELQIGSGHGPVHHFFNLANNK
ncbi:bifunctional hydroxymethylpyrimidine kinase/phosphomethylpyrimidine kinase [Photobacterium damselae subsp. damselae]|uniref:bifunctional hydroxymethylpyrimidine kinase/phosphomethylpyrimidine kinase n=1 Tax=Photobacterium damselae TaxID=38293 RepID=UPI00084A9B76|nr:bifunctional hydroxymethylpyrimidine kinase/phosphomethylpyrimidine kinase [Photobacterium damselae]NVH47353.1 bifunctional hydroxymethylpyrimidine kinase/phosphomethylpyrimidine kinase [Photobacterium damselae subsp. damselae]OEC82766.1 bifunctional hydroxymethylpyrimidine kinase/phosphomethylpyrimidine kinase [Photobacterium damselae subsp. damselae]PSB80147.1 bifunctional hydroxymethylpyrimidine kinase/phosphomethylpyrimidine kinase [Photobacterium damselae subsp. damselae]